MDFRNCLKRKDSEFFEHLYFGDHVLSIQIDENDRHLETGELMFFNVACWKVESHGEGEAFGPFVPVRDIVPPELANQHFLKDDVPYGLTVEETQQVFDAFVDYGYKYLEQFR